MEVSVDTFIFTYRSGYKCLTTEPGNRLCFGDWISKINQDVF